MPFLFCVKERQPPAMQVGKEKLKRGKKWQNKKPWYIRNGFADQKLKYQGGLNRERERHK